MEKKNAEISTRIAEMIDLIDENPNSFAKILGYSRAQTIYDIINGKSAPSYDFFNRFANTEFSDKISLQWLLTGKGEMLKEKLSEPVQAGRKASPTINYEYKGAPYYNVDFIGGFDVVLNDQTVNPDYYINFVPYNKPGVIWCNITGHSMEPELNNGDFIAMKEMTTPIEYLPYGEIYGIVTDDFRTVKRIRMSEKKGYVRLIPTNKSPEYAEQEIPVTMIRKVFAVLGSMHRLF